MRKIKILSPRKGAALVEYCLLASLISIVSIGAIHGFGTKVADSFDTVAIVLEDSVSDAGDGFRPGGQTRSPSDPGGGGEQPGPDGPEGGYVIPAVYVQACENNATSMKVAEEIYHDSNNDGQFVRGGWLHGQPFHDRLYFNTSSEQEVYSGGGEPNRFGQVTYSPSHILPPYWNPCIDDQGYPPVTAPS